MTRRGRGTTAATLGLLLLATAAAPAAADGHGDDSGPSPNAADDAGPHADDDHPGQGRDRAGPHQPEDGAEDADDRESDSDPERESTSDADNQADDDRGSHDGQETDGDDRDREDSDQDRDTQAGTTQDGPDDGGSGSDGAAPHDRSPITSTSVTGAATNPSDGPNADGGAGADPRGDGAGSTDDEPAVEPDGEPEVRLTTQAFVASDEQGRKVVRLDDDGQVEITFLYVVRNTGTTPLTVVQLEDARVPALDVSALDDPELAPGETLRTTTTATFTSEDFEAGQLTTEGEVAAAAPDGQETSDTAADTVQLAGMRSGGEGTPDEQEHAGAPGETAQAGAAGDGDRRWASAGALVLILAAALGLAHRLRARTRAVALDRAPAVAPLPD